MGVCAFGSSKIKSVFCFVIPLICTNFMSLRAMKVLMLGKTQNIFGFSLAYSYLYVALRHEVRLHLNKKRNFFFVLSSICTNFAPRKDLLQ